MNCSLHCSAVGDTNFCSCGALLATVMQKKLYRTLLTTVGDAKLCRFGFYKISALLAHLLIGECCHDAHDCTV